MAAIRTLRRRGHRPLHRHEPTGVGSPERPHPAGGTGARPTRRRRARRARRPLPAGVEPPVVCPHVLPRPGLVAHLTGLVAPRQRRHLRHQAAHRPRDRPVLHRDVPRRGVAQPPPGAGRCRHLSARDFCSGVWLAHSDAALEADARRPRARGLRRAGLRGLLLVEAVGRVRDAGVHEQHPGVILAFASGLFFCVSDRVRPRPQRREPRRRARPVRRRGATAATSAG